LERDLESIFRAGMLKILLQQYRHKADMPAHPPNVCFRGDSVEKVGGCDA
jgi:hypothetical protein